TVNANKVSPSDVTRYTLHVTRHTLHLTPHTSHLTPHTARHRHVRQNRYRPYAYSRVSRAHGRLLARCELSFSRSDLPARQSTLARAARARAHQASSARSLGDDT